MEDTWRPALCHLATSTGPSLKPPSELICRYNRYWLTVVRGVHHEGRRRVPKRQGSASKSTAIPESEVVLQKLVGAPMIDHCAAESELAEAETFSGRNQRITCRPLDQEMLREKKCCFPASKLNTWFRNPRVANTTNRFRGWFGSLAAGKSLSLSLNCCQTTSTSRDIL